MATAAAAPAATAQAALETRAWLDQREGRRDPELPLLSIGQGVKYWSTSQERWIDAVVVSVDARGAVQLDVKRGAWISRLAQAAKVRADVAGVDLDGARGAVVKGSRTRGPLDDDCGIVPQLHSTPASSSSASASASASTCAQRAGVVTGSREMFASFSAWDARRQRSEAQEEARAEAEGCLRRVLKLEMALLQHPLAAMKNRVPSLLWRELYQVIRDRAAALQAERQAGSAGTAAAEALASFLDDVEVRLLNLCSSVDRRATAAAAGHGRSPELRRALLHCVSLLHTMLADVERYRWTYEIGVSPSDALRRAERLYGSALEAFPQLGHTFNQRGLLAAHLDDYLGAVFFGFRAVLCTCSFANSRQNLLLWLGRASSVQNSARTECLAACAQSLRGLLSGDVEDSALLEERAASAFRKVLGMDVTVEHGGSVAPALEGEWLLQFVMVNVCAALHFAYEARLLGCEPYATEPALEALRCTGSVGSGDCTAAAWRLVVALAACLASRCAANACEGASEDAALAALALLAVLCARLLPGSWDGATSLHQSLRALVSDCEVLTDSEEASQEATAANAPRLLQALPEDHYARGLLLLLPEAAAVEARVSAEAPACGGVTASASGEDNEDEDEDEVVLLAPVVAETSAASPDGPSAASRTAAAATAAAPSVELSLRQIRLLRLAACLPPRWRRPLELEPPPRPTPPPQKLAATATAAEGLSSCDGEGCRDATAEERGRQSPRRTGDRPSPPAMPPPPPPPEAE
eukprot:TRINITY_DN21244_c0_g1_i1.p1 TRINITY_DN21244_c0_g1~~TRINITY_DN21244_c0_g1_i1.p1  ORF type:complete len:766 (+),score=167.06 TRINITY_DN21244_c0_g1_i1:29-2299(+)